MKPTRIHAGATGSALLALMLCAPLLLSAAEPQELEAHARALEARLMAPCCYSQTVDVHDSDAARQVRAELRHWLREGLGEQEVLDRFVERYGARILAVPPASGFNRWLYWLPAWLTAGATAAVFWLLWLWRRRGSAAGGV
jgi:cytochrome c-type biogenesis protein CcmH